MSRITVLGMGAMGSRMAMSLLKAGHEVTVWNRSSDKTKTVRQTGAKVVDTPYVAVQNAEFVISMVRDDEASKEVWLSDSGALAGMSEAVLNDGKEPIAIESSTLSVSWIKELAIEFNKRKVALLDAPVAGTLPQAEAAQLIYFVGGERETFERARPVLQAMGNKINYAGTVGNGMTIKLAVNSLFAIQVAAMGELIGAIAKIGLDKDRAVEIIADTPVCSLAAENAAKAIVANKFAPLFPLELVAKDLDYAIATARDNQASLSLVETTQEICQTAIQQGYGANNITGIARIY